MARVRQISPRAPKDEDLAALSWPARTAFYFLPCHADCEGRLEDRPKYLKSEIFPYDDVDMESVLAELAAPRMQNPGPFIVRYQVNGRRYIQVLRFYRYQNPHPNERKAYDKARKSGDAIPPPAKDLLPKTVAATSRDVINNVSDPADDGTSRAGSSVPSEPSEPSGSSDPLAKTPFSQPVYWDEAEQQVVIDEDWLHNEIDNYQTEAGVRLTRKEYEHEAEQLRLKLLADPRLRALMRKANGEPSVESQFKRLATFTAGHFKSAIRQKANREKRPERKTAVQLAVEAEARLGSRR